jgi:hypothetical protein
LVDVAKKPSAVAFVQEVHGYDKVKAPVGQYAGKRRRVEKLDGCGKTGRTNLPRAECHRRNGILAPGGADQLLRKETLTTS